MLSYLDSNVLKDYDTFSQVAGNYYSDASEISQMMTRFAEHAMQLGTSFTEMNGKITHISETMEENAKDITGIVEYTGGVAESLDEIDGEIKSCNTIAAQMKKNLEIFRNQTEEKQSDATGKIIGEEVCENATSCN